jgi:hypothetical protein
MIEPRNIVLTPAVDGLTLKPPSPAEDRVIVAETNKTPGKFL